MSGQQNTAEERRDGRTVAVLGPDPSMALALALESGAVLVDDAAAADVVHLTHGPAVVAEALADVLESARCVVLHERPAAIVTAELDELSARAAAAGSVVAVPFVDRYYPMVRLARRRIRSGAPGPLHMLHGWATHDALTAWIDLLEFVSDHRLERVVAAAVAASSVHSSGDQPDTPGAIGLLFGTDRGAVGTLAVSQTRPVEGGSLLLVLDGVEESVLFHEGRPEVLDVMGSRSTQRFQRGVGAEVSRYSTQPVGRPQGRRDCWASFVADAYSAAGGTIPDGLPTLNDLARASSLTAAVDESYESGRWADVRLLPDHDPLNITEGKSA